MKPFFPLNLPFRMSLAAVAVLASAAALGVSSASGQTFYKPTGTIYESSQNTTRSAAGLFDDNAAFGATIVSTNSFFTGSGGAGGDSNPTAAFSLASTALTNGFGYAQNILGIPTGPDKVSSIDVYSLTLAQYNAYIASAPLVVSPGVNQAIGTNGPAASRPAPAAGNFLANQTVAITNTSGDGVFTQYNFTAPLAGQYFVVQFHPLAGSGGFPGGAAFQLFAVPEPSAWAMLALGVAVLAIATMRCRRARPA